MKFMDKIYGFIFNKMSDLFPIGGGAAGALSQVDTVAQNGWHLPSHEVLIPTIIIAAIGASIGYLIKLLFDIIFRNTRKKFNIK